MRFSKDYLLLGSILWLLLLSCTHKQERIVTPC